MKQALLDSAVGLGEKLQHIFVATSDEGGVPHLAAAGKIARGRPGRVTVGAWFCPRTIENLRRNPRISLVAWDRATDDGYQLLGEVEEIIDESVLDGFDPRIEEPAIPQVEHEVVVRVSRVMRFKHAPHTDLEE